MKYTKVILQDRGSCWTGFLPQCPSRPLPRGTPKTPGGTPITPVVTKLTFKGFVKCPSSAKLDCKVSSAHPTTYLSM